MAIIRHLLRSLTSPRGGIVIRYGVENHIGSTPVVVYVTRRNFSSGQPSGIDLTDLTLPHTWYPFARKKKRLILLHVGPTNSGKTYSALQRLQSCSSGVYCGPLRLLAWEIAERMNMANVPCSLITGQERKEIEGAQHKSVTVEMADLSQQYTCAVIDEIQMIGCPTRGFSFTRALLGLAADELHLCGDPAVVELIKNIIAPVGDIVEVHEYERLSPLSPSTRPLGTFSSVQSGDCIVTFSRRSIHNIKKMIEVEGTHKCSLVYGSLPPETRSRQADQFNNKSNGFNVLVASDAIGMGLNLNIRRIIFSSLEKFDGESIRPLTVMEIKQIAGRAGRYGSQFPEGEVTCLKAHDLPILHQSIQAPSVPIEAAGLFPTFELLALFSSLHPNLTFAEILEEFITKARLSPHYRMTSCIIMAEIALVLEKLPLSFKERFIFCSSPVDIDDHICFGSLLEFADSYCRDETVLLEKYFTPATLSIPRTPAHLVELESIHKVFELYIWLSFHLEHAFVDRNFAISQKEICSLLIEKGLNTLGWKGSGRDRLNYLRQRQEWIALER